MPDERSGRVLTLDPAPLVERIAQGDAAAEDALVSHFRPRVLGAMWMRTRDPEAAQELANDVLVAVVCALRAGRLRDANKLHAFVNGIARNVANNHLRARRGRPWEEPLPADLPSTEEPDTVEQGERLAAMRRGLDQLSGADREVLLLTLVEGFKPRQIASRLGLSSDVVRARKSRALHRLIAHTRRSDV